MRLAIRETLSGQPDPGDVVDVSLSGGRLMTLKYSPHPIWDDHLWQVEQDGDVPDELIVSMKELRERAIETSFVACYLEPDRPVAVGAPLRMRVVPRGNMSNWPAIQQTLDEVVDIVIKY